MHQSFGDLAACERRPQCRECKLGVETAAHCPTDCPAAVDINNHCEIHKVLTPLPVKPLKRIHRLKKYKRYSQSIPGECVQMDTCNIMADLYLYTAIEDCSRYKVISIYPRRSVNNTIKYLDEVIEEMPFPIQRIQTDRGKEFFAIIVQEK
jgi:hypothetical protein